MRHYLTEKSSVAGLFQWLRVRPVEHYYFWQLMPLYGLAVLLAPFL
jgi:hypothetical protein